MTKGFATSISICVLLVCSAAFGAEPSHESLEFFEAKIRPVLVDKCYSCHSEDSKKLKGDLRVDTAAALLRGGESGTPSVVPGNPEKSKLIEAIEYKTDDLQMPPKEKLSAETIADFKAWIAMGAPDPRVGPKATSQPSHLDIAAAKRDWWSFKLPQPRTPPTVKGSAWAKTPIDLFILAKLEAKGLAPSKPADPRTLLRRATFDLTGLPPTAEEVAAFEADRSPDAFEKVVDRLLSSPHYGERWGRYWLDVARYADTKGYVFQEERKYPFAYTYRDWVVHALNADMPYDQFLIDQVAADRVVSGSDTRNLAAMGFLTVGRRFLNSQPDIIDDRMDVLCRGTMAMTVACARCHDHKFDPIPTKDYYSLYGIFASSMEPTELPKIGSGERTPDSEAFDVKLAAARAALARARAEKFVEINAEIHTPKAIADYLMAVRVVRDAKDDDRTGVQATAMKLNVRKTVLARWKLYLARASTPADAVWSAWEKLSRLPDDQIAANVDVTVKGTPNALVAEALRVKAPKSARDVAEAYAGVIAKYAGRTPLQDANAEALRHVLDADGGPVAFKEAELDTLLNKLDKNQLVVHVNAIAKIVANDPGSPARAMVMNDLPQPVEPHVFKRGNPGNVGDAVPREFLAVLSPEKRPEYKQGSGRLELAKAIASKDNPLTARVMVNRVWGHHFGQGIVRTPSDFGRRGEQPSHPELLDYLALKFEGEGWSLKKLHREIMLSAVYQQGSDEDATARLADPENTLCWKFNRQRLDFEATRDALLAVSGQLDEQVGGKSVDLIAQPFTHRRTVYGFIDRQNLPNMFRAFDFASPDSHSPRRYFTTVPQQALFMMNSPFVIDAAKSVAKRPEVAGASDPALRISKLYEAIFDRPATADEVQMGMSFVGEVSEKAQLVVTTPAWQYGVGEYDDSLEAVKAFKPLPVFTGSVWQGGPALPDPALSFASLTAGGGHPGSTPALAVVRRWTAPRDGPINIAGILGHAAKQGDGVRGRIVHGREGLLGVWTVKGSQVDTKLASVPVKAGDTIDFIVDCIASPDFDSFSWAPVLTAADGKVWNAQSDFAGDTKPKPDRSMDAWEKYAQVLLETNEFVFVD